MYVDGSLEDTNIDPSGSLTTNQNNVRIGADYNTFPDNFFNGSIDEVRIYNYALASSIIEKLYRLGARRFAPD